MAKGFGITRRTFGAGGWALPFLALPHPLGALGTATVVRDMPTAPVGLALIRQNAESNLLIGGQDGQWLLHPGTSAVERAPWPASGRPTTAIAANEDLVAAAGAGWVQLWDRHTGQPMWDSVAVRSPRALALTPDGTVYVTDSHTGQLIRLTKGGLGPIASGLRRPVGLFVDGDTDAWVTEYDAGQVVYINLKTGLIRPLVFALRGPTAVARLNTGYLAVAEPTFGRVLFIDPKTGERTPLAGGLALAVDDLDLPADTATGLAVDVDDTVYVACPGDRSIVRLVPDIRLKRDKR